MNSNSHRKCLVPTQYSELDQLASLMALDMPKAVLTDRELPACNCLVQVRAAKMRLGNAEYNASNVDPMANS